MSKNYANLELNSPAIWGVNAGHLNSPPFGGLGGKENRGQGAKRLNVNS
jgi:hypothetical protein